ncbi:FAD/NAD(P)-binding protein [Clostridium sp. CM028]|uniref:FAD/NAD(P)-binding protein n=1 Tax=unclassified Clostridium TaxID=2614128 RepID=UPI001C6F11DD|nr:MULTISPECIES: FAD/NAD(P)-binding protein [unclassified Clostridium]MBW9144356.1 FAD/NAD(P)-binding protein [Clostridium sp. CM027]MBW9149406.1 FAD/NAD(P)-binding protein [Clostridium sp. CM028]UVE41012.1 FAD/NAD(P)-binding protein [Clostridium sp. CM027]WLC61679.1 FAD/NAD(P)-binding protein [Clostridium sp. CM028]
MSCNCNVHEHKHVNPLMPELAEIVDIREETHDVTTFRVTKPGGGKSFEHMPGQCAMISVPPLGEAIFSITSSPTEKGYMEFSVKRCGVVTEYLHGLEVGSEIGIRGPYGNNFPVEDELKGKDLLFIGGGIGLAPIRSVINYVMDNRDDYGKVDILYGARTPGDLVQTKDIFENWPSRSNTDVYLTVDREVEGWEGHVGFVPSYIKEIGFSTNKVALVCGPPIMIKFVLQTLEEMGFKKDQVYTTLELKMKCGVGKCGRCNIGDKYVCKDGPVFRCDEIDQLPDEY